jgi:hypothetical protein
MKKAILLTLLLSVYGLSQAQTITKKQVIGKWKAIALEIKGKRYSVNDEASLTQGLLATAKQTPSSADSAVLISTAKMLFNLISDMQFEFKNNDTVYLSIKFTLGGKTDTEKDVAPYTLVNNRMSWDKGRGRMESFDISMPDPQTLIFMNFTSAGGKNLVLKRQ